MPRRSRAAVVKAGVAGGVVSGAPSTAWALATGRDPLEAARAAGTLVPGFRRRGGLVPGLVAHAAITAVWTAVLAAVLPRSRTLPGGAVSGAVAGVAIAAVDLGAVARRAPAIRALPQRPQWADHVAFGAVVGVVLAAAGPDHRDDAPAARSRCLGSRRRRLAAAPPHGSVPCASTTPSSWSARRAGLRHQAS